MAKLLLVEDDRLFVRLYEDRLAMEGFDVQVAKDGIEGLAKAEADVPDLIMLDLMMPRMSGFEMLEKMKAHDLLKEVPVLVFTNMSSEADEKRVRDMGATDYLVKAENPPDKVIASVKSILGLTQ